MPSKRPNSITFLPTNRDVEVSQKDDSLLSLALREKINLNHTCGGNGTCGTCRVIVKEGLGLLSDRNELEAEMYQDRGFAENERLACQTAPCGGLVIEVPSSSKA